MNSRAYFDAVAGRWDEMRKTFYSDDVREEALSRADLRPDALAADIGAGTGFLTEGLIGRGLKVIAIDQSASMLAWLKSKYENYDGLECRLGRAERLMVADEVVDYAFANMYLHHVEDPGEAIKEMVRIMKAGGTLVITDLDEHEYEFLRDEHHDRWLGFKREDVAKWFSEAGLMDVKVSGIGEECCAESLNNKGSARVSIFVASGIKKRGGGDA